MFRDIDTVQDELDEAKARLNVLENNENEDEYEAMLDEEGPVQVGCLSFDPSAILRELDPTAYACGFSDFNDAEQSELMDKVKELEDELEELKKEAAAEKEGTSDSI